MVWNKEESDRPRLGMNEDDARKTGYQKGMAISKSLLLHRCRPGVGLDNIHFTLQDGWYEPPWMLREAGMRGLSEAMGGFSSKHYNGTTLSVRGATILGNHIEFNMQRSCYFNHLITNHLADTPLVEGLTPRQILEPGPSLNDLDETMAENRLGMCCLMKTTDGFFILPQRSSRVGVFAGQLSASVMGAANMAPCRDDKGGYSARAWLQTEVREELPFLTDERGRIDSRLMDMRHVRVLGITREMVRCGKPEVFLGYDLPVDLATLLDLLNDQERVSKGRAAHHIDHVENDRILMIHEDEIFETLSEVIGTAHGRPSQHPVIIHQGEVYRVSESLLSNLLLHRMGR